MSIAADSILPCSPIDCNKLFEDPGWKVIEEDNTLPVGSIRIGGITTKSYKTPDEGQILVEEYLCRVRVSQDIQLNGSCCQALIREKDRQTLRWLREAKHINRLEFFGTIFQDSNGDKYVLFLWCDLQGYWSVDAHKLNQVVLECPAGIYQP